jgi:two-component sensor histidine kinase
MCLEGEQVEGEEVSLIRAQLRLEPAATSARRARRFIADMLTRWGEATRVELTTLLVSELVTNAVVHAGTDLTVRVTLTGRNALLAVADRGRARELGSGAEGHGLRVVDQLSRRWGAQTRLGDGMVVWAVLDVDVRATAVLPQQAVRYR